MGAVLAAMQSSDASDASSDLNLPDLPENIWIEILSHVPSSDLVKNCLLVCHQWKDLLLSHAVWKMKCLREGKTIPLLDKRKKIPKNFYRQICIYNPFGRNLVKNPCGEDHLNHWTIHQNLGNGWAVEQPPQGADEVPAEVGTKSCFATSFSDCVKYQVIDLLKEGLTEEILDNYKPAIHVGEWHAARFDCGSKYQLCIALLGKDRFELVTHDFGPIIEPQWAGRIWSKLSHVFTDYPCGVRYIGFEHSGSDTQFWAGHYGSKMTGAYVKITMGDK